MPRKLTYNEIKHNINNNSKFQLLTKEDEYINTSNKLLLKCKENGHISEKLYYTAMTKGCIMCVGNYVIPTKEVKEEFYNNGFIWLDDREYKNNNIKYKCKCLECELEQFKNLDSIRNNYGCPRCSKCYRPTTEEVIELFLKNNYKWLDNREYKNAHTPMKCKCLKCNTIQYKCKNDIKRYGCKICSVEKIKQKISGKNHYNWNLDRKIIKRNRNISDKCVTMLKNCLRLLDIKKTRKTEEMLGYSRKELLEHLESFDNFNELIENNDKWHIDHIIPISILISLDITDLKIINHLSNLQPLSEFDNLSKSNSYDIYDVINYLNKHNINMSLNEIYLKLKENNKLNKCLNDLTLLKETIGDI